MNMQNIMAQAQKLQKEIEKTKSEIEGKTFESENAFLKVQMNGKKEIESVNIKLDKIETDDVEVLEDMIKIAINDCIEKINQETNQKMGKYGNSLNGLL